MKKHQIKVDRDIYEVVKSMRDEYQVPLAKQMIADFDASGFVLEPKKKVYPSYFFEPIAESATFTN